MSRADHIVSGDAYLRRDFERSQEAQRVEDFWRFADFTTLAKPMTPEELAALRRTEES